MCATWWLENGSYFKELTDYWQEQKGELIIAIQRLKKRGHSDLREEIWINTAGRHQRKHCGYGDLQSRRWVKRKAGKVERKQEFIKKTVCLRMASHLEQ